MIKIEVADMRDDGYGRQGNRVEMAVEKRVGEDLGQLRQRQ